jgi:hypothetical protein
MTEFNVAEPRGGACSEQSHLPELNHQAALLQDDNGAVQTESRHFLHNSESSVHLLKKFFLCPFRPFKIICHFSDSNSVNGT